MTPDPDRIVAALDAAGCVTPALLIDLAQVERNIAAMIRRVGDPARWRPHVKTFKQARIVALLLDAGVRHFKCATVPELRMVVDRGALHGLDIDVLLAYPIAAVRLGEVAALARHATHARIGITADDPQHLDAILEVGGIEAWLDVDVGMHRTGSLAQTWQRWATTRGGHDIVGLQGYEGHVGWGDRSAAVELYEGLGDLARSLGSCRWLLTSGSLAFDHALGAAGLRPDAAGGDRWIHQIGAGTLVLGDVASTAAAAAIGAAPSTFVASRVVARPGPGRVTLDAGSKALAPDRPPPNCAVLGHPRWQPLTPSEEHLPVWLGDDDAPARDTIVLLVPDHVCTTVNLHREAIYLRDGVLCGVGPIDAGGREAPGLAPRSP